MKTWRWTRRAPPGETERRQRLPAWARRSRRPSSSYTRFDEEGASPAGARAQRSPSAHVSDALDDVSISHATVIRDRLQEAHRSSWRLHLWAVAPFAFVFVLVGVPSLVALHVTPAASDAFFWCMSAYYLNYILLMHAIVPTHSAPVIAISLWAAYGNTLIFAQCIRAAVRIVADALSSPSACRSAWPLARAAYCGLFGLGALLIVVDYAPRMVWGLWKGGYGPRSNRRFHRRMHSSTASAAVFGLLCGMLPYGALLGSSLPGFWGGSSSAAIAAVVGAQLAGLVNYLWPGLQRRTQALVASRTEGIASAAAIATMFAPAAHGGAAAIIASATARMRAVPAELLSVEVFTPDAPDTPVEMANRFYQLSTPWPLADVDAFISHSWHDDPALKWAAFEGWRHDFRDTHNGREPVVWLDRCCIDQADIGRDLPNLPLYLAGCSSLVVLKGATYLDRLWCVVELFTFTHLRGIEVEVRHIGAPEDGAHADGAKGRRPRAPPFDVRACKATSAADYSRLMAVVDATGGALEFSRHVSRLVLGADPGDGGGSGDGGGADAEPPRKPSLRSGHGLGAGPSHTTAGARAAAGAHGGAVTFSEPSQRPPRRPREYTRTRSQQFKTSALGRLQRLLCNRAVLGSLLVVLAYLSLALALWAHASARARAECAACEARGQAGAGRWVRAGELELRLEPRPRPAARAAEACAAMGAALAVLPGPDALRAALCLLDGVSAAAWVGLVRTPRDRSWVPRWLSAGAGRRVEVGWRWRDGAARARVPTPGRAAWQRSWMDAGSLLRRQEQCAHLIGGGLGAWWQCAQPLPFVCSRAVATPASSSPEDR